MTGTTRSMWLWCSGSLHRLQQDNRIPGVVMMETLRTPCMVAAMLDVEMSDGVLCPGLVLVPVF
jgi:hypothetical protein